MARRLVGLAVLLLSLAAGTVDLAAQRNGFIIGFGLGAGVNSYTVGIEGFSETSERVTRTGVSSDLKIGGQVNPNLLLYYRNLVVFTGDEFADLVAGGESGVGITYIPTDSKLHVNAMIGIAAFTSISDGSADGYTGLGVAGGLGYEFSDHWIIDAGVLLGRPGDGDIKYNLVQFKAGLNVLSH